MAAEHSNTAKQTATRKRLNAGLFLLAAGYLLQIFSPLRLNTDSIRYLSMALSAYHGHGYLVGGRPDQFPTAFPFFVKVMLQLHIARSMTFIIFNLLWLLVGLWVLRAWYKPQGGSRRTLLVIILFLASWITIKHISLPMTDFFYFGISSLSIFFLWLFWQQNGRRKWFALAISLSLSYLALNCRSVGLTIFPVILITALLHKDIGPAINRIMAKKWLALAAICVLAMLFVVIVLMVRQTSWYTLQFSRPGSYFQSLLGAVRRDGIILFAFHNFCYRVLEFGVIFSNVPGNKVLQLRPLLYFIGVMAWAGVLYGAWLLAHVKRLWPWLLYFLSYAALMFLWPYYDTRFWLPLLPILAVLFLTAVDDLVSRWPAIRFALQSYLVIFLIIGFVALLFSTRISLSGRGFSELYGDGTMRMTYRFAFQNGKQVDMHQVNAGQVRLLRIFEPLANINTTGNGQPIP